MQGVTIRLMKEPGGLKNGDIYLFQGRKNAWFIRGSTALKLQPFETEPVGSMVINDYYYLQMWAGNKDNKLG